MLLYNAPTSPFGRKVMAVAIETGQASAIQTIPTKVLPARPNEELGAVAPIGMVPALRRTDGTVLYDSRVICEFLDSTHGRRKLFPEAPEARWHALRRQALGDAIVDAGLAIRFENAVRPEPLRWPTAADAQRRRILRIVSAVGEEAADLPRQADIGTIALACALGYLDWRFEQAVPWRSHTPELARWMDDFAERASMRDTAPEA